MGFDTIPQTAEEFDFPPEKSRRLMINSIVCGALLYALVLIAVAIIIPYTDLLGQNHTLDHGRRGQYGFRQASAASSSPSLSSPGILTGMNGFFMATTRLLFSMGRGKFLHPWFLKVHPKHGTPTNAVLFTLGLTLIAPVVRPLGPELDRRHVRHGHRARLSVPPASTAYKYVAQFPRPVPEARWGKSCGRSSVALTSIACFLDAGCARLSGCHWVRIVDYAARMGSHRCLLLL